MKQFLFLFIFIFSGSIVKAQLPQGSKLPGNIVATDIKGNAVDVFADLAAGKTVVLDVFATWCGPCWSFHQSEVLRDLYSQLGPAGSNQVRIYGIESDPDTPLSHLYQKVAGTNTVPSSLGNWTEGVEYSIINSDLFADLLKISGFPTIYLIRPDKTLMEVPFTVRTDLNFWKKVVLGEKQKDAIFTNDISEEVFCVSRTLPKVKILNIGTTPVTNVTIDLVKNGVSTLSNYSISIPVFGEAELTLKDAKITETAEIEVNLEAIDDIDVIADDSYSIVTDYYRPLITKNVLKVKFTTDYYPGETSWKLEDNKGRVLKSIEYNPGNEDQYGGGGADANMTFSYDITIDKIDISCLTFTTKDEFGDGMLYWRQGDPVPGVEFYSSEDVLIKPVLVEDFYFQSAVEGMPSSTSSYVAADIISSLGDQELVQNFSVNPNPVTDVLNIDMTIKSGSDFEVLITDILGANVYKVPRNATFHDVSALNSGIYFLSVRTEGNTYTKKFTKI